METAEDCEKKFERAMERLFSGSPPTPAASSAGASSPVKRKKDVQQAVSSVWPPRSSGTIVPPSGFPGCRPWDRGDLLRRLATYKSITWFGKPQVAGPVACARRGWVNVDVDLLGCEVCGSRLSFPVPPSWSRHQVERAAQSFAEQLDTAHKGLCAWRNNSCADTLAQFPPMPLPALVGAYMDRCEALLQLSALPVVSQSGINQMKTTRGPQVDHLLAEPTPTIPGFLVGNSLGSNVSGDRSLITNNKAFYQAQRVIAVCGWEPRLLPYTVDCEDRSAAQTAKHNGPAGKAREPGPSVVVHNRADLPQESARSQVNSQDAPASDPASAVLDCSLCGASVGLWNFTTIDRPSPLLVSGMADLPGPAKTLADTGVAGVSAASCIDGWGLAGLEVAEELRAEVGEAVTGSVIEKPAPQKGVLDLKLTIAGGPPPTRLAAPALVPSTFGIPGIHHHGGQPETSETGDCVAASYESRGPAQWERGTDHGGSALATTQHGMPLAADSVEGTVVDRQEGKGVDDEGKDVEHTSKRKRDTASVKTQQAEGSQYLQYGKRKRVEIPGGFMRQPRTELPRASSVNAVDTCYQRKQENSMESVENFPQESDGQGTTTGENHGDGPETVVQAEHSMRHRDGTEPGLSKSDEGGGEEGAETNLAVISTGTLTGGGVSVGMGGGGSVGMAGSHEAEIQDDVDALERGESVADFVTDVTGLMDEFVPGRGLMDEFVLEDIEKADAGDNHGDSREVLPGISHTFTKDAGESGESLGKGGNSGAGENREGEGTLDIANAVIQSDVGDPNPQGKEVIDGHMEAEILGQKNKEVQSPARNPTGLPAEDVRKWETDTGEFDPIWQHRHFCPWVNGHVAAAGSSSSAAPLCGWQLTLDSLQQRHPPAGLAESESTASKYKENPLASVRKLLGRRSPPKQRLRARIES